MKSKDQKFIPYFKNIEEGTEKCGLIQEYFSDSIPDFDGHSPETLANYLENFDARTPPLQIIDSIIQRRRERAKSLGVTDEVFRSYMRAHGFRILFDNLSLYTYLKSKRRLTKESKDWMRRIWQIRNYEAGWLEEIGAPGFYRKLKPDD